MALANYTDLTGNIAAWLDRTDLTSVIPDFITLAEGKINRRLRTKEMESITSGLTMTAGDNTYDFPTDALSISKFKLISGEVYELDQLSKELLVRKFPHNIAARPKAFTVDGNQLIVAPPPDGDYDYELSYYTGLDLETDSTNWLMTRYPDAYLYGSLLEAAPYLTDSEKIAVWEIKFAQVMQEIESADKRDRWMGGSLYARAV